VSSHLTMRPRRRGKSLGNAGVVLIALAVVVPMAAPGIDVRWWLAVGLLVAGAPLHGSVLAAR
jgi:hypothetical protein